MTANEALDWGLAQALDHVLRPPAQCNGSCRAEDCSRCERDQYAVQGFEPDTGDGCDRPGTCSYERNPSDKHSSVAR